MKRVAIIGGGLAGTSCAYVLKQRGFEPVIYEEGESLAPGASGNALGLYNPRISAERSFHAEAFESVLKVFKELKNIDWKQCGSLHLVTDDKKQKRFVEAVKNWGWGERMKMLDAHEASRVAGVEIDRSALYLPESGVVSPKKLCAAYAKDIEVHLNAKIMHISDVKADAIVITNGMAAMNFEETKDLPLKAVRGQITFIAPTENSAKVKCNLCYGGYFTPAIDGQHMVGSTFQRWLDHSEILDGDDADNISKLAKFVPSIAGDFKITGHRAAVRTTTGDHMPYMSAVAGHKGLYVSVAHGSHGIITSLAAAQRIGDDMMARA